ncbi:MAG TPA: PaaI family thioesterase [Planktothrix sp.]
MTGKYEWNMLSALGGSMLEVREGYARGILPLTEAVMQPTRVYHAGAIVMLADEVASTAINGRSAWDEESYKNLFPYSIQLSVNLLTNDPVGPMTAEANVVRHGRITVVDTVVTTASGQTAALMRSAHMMVDLSKTGPHRKK